MTDASRREPPSDDLRLELEILDARPGQAAADLRGDGTGLTLLVADDDAEIRLYVSRCIQSLPGPVGRVIGTADGHSALEHLQRGEAQLLVCDALMPGLDGFELCAAIRRDPALRALPVLLISGQVPLGQARKRAERAGADAILAKPFNARRLCEAIENMLGKRALPRAPPRPPPDPEV